ncbi:MAG: hypothetical protein U9P90_02670, partial [Patescibacteria group bacterium]|nr:hypothetical protein [Patescibacteria group bacterium]
MDKKNKTHLIIELDSATIEECFAKQKGDYGIYFIVTKNLEQGNIQLTLVLGTTFRVENDYVILENPETGDAIFFKTRWVLRILERPVM